MLPVEILDLSYGSASRYSDYCCLNKDYSYTVNEAVSFALHGFASYKNQTSKGIQASMYYILRSAKTGAYASETMRFTASADAQPYTLSVDLDELLQKIQDDYFDIPQGQYTWEIYLDGMLFCQGNFTIK